MGLDQYLTKKTYIKNWDHLPPEQRYEISVLRGGVPVPTIRAERIIYVEEEVGYWRKANAIHAWFVRAVQEGRDECQTSDVSEDQLRELLSLCQEVQRCPARAPDILPTQEGFFFGSPDYDEWYLKNIEQTIRIVSAALEDIGGGDFYYRASW